MGGGGGGGGVGIKRVFYRIWYDRNILKLQQTKNYYYERYLDLCFNADYYSIGLVRQINIISQRQD